MKIILAHYKYYIQGGPERYMLKFMALAESYGHVVIPFSIKNRNNIATDFEQFFVDPADMSSSSRFDATSLTLKSALIGLYNQFHNRDAYRKMKALLQKEHPDVVYCLIPGELTSDIFRAANEEGVPVILRLSDFRCICGCNILLRNGNICEDCIHGDYYHVIKNRCVKNSAVLSAIRAIALDVDRRCNHYRYVDAVIAPPKHTADKYVESGFFPAEKVHVNPTFIECADIEPCYSHNNYVLCLGRFSHEKGFIYVIEALRYLKDIPVQVAVTGDRDNCSEELRKVIDTYNLVEKVRFVGFLSGRELENVTQNAMCVACPAIWYENMPNTVLEAYAYGKPVIASNIGSLAEIVEDGVTGLLFDPKNSKQIADCIRKLYEAPELCMRLGKQGRKMCETVYSPQRHWNNFMSIYEEIKKEK